VGYQYGRLLRRFWWITNLGDVERGSQMHLHREGDSAMTTKSREENSFCVGVWITELKIHVPGATMWATKNKFN